MEITTTLNKDLFVAAEDPKQPLPLLEEALRTLAKLLKAARYYPPAHPSLQRAVEAALEDLLQSLQNQPSLVLLVGKEGFHLGEKGVGASNPILKQLASFFFSRRISHLMILPDLSPRDLLAFTRCLLLEPNEIQKMGGVREVLIKAHVSTLWVNATELDKILARKEELDREKAARLGAESQVSEGEEDFSPDKSADSGEAGKQASPEEAPEEEQDLAKILQELQVAETDQRYRLLLDELVPLVRLNLTEGNRQLILQAMDLLCRNATSRHLPMARREYCLHALNQLDSDDILDYLVALLCTKGIADQIRRRIIGILGFLKENVVHRLMDHLAAERDAQARKFLTEALIAQGIEAIPTLSQFLADERWFVIRNAVAILGEIREQEAIASLTPLLRHKDIRVRRETIRSLTKIGGPDAVGLLLRTVQEGDDELSRQALLSLGAMKNPAAVPTLLKLVSRPDPMVKHAEIKKGAIKALGEIGAPEAAPTLQAVLKHRKFWQRSRFDAVRAAAALALGEIGDEASAALLETAADDRSEPVARAAVQALKLLKKGEEHG